MNSHVQPDSHAITTPFSPASLGGPAPSFGRRPASLGPSANRAGTGHDSVSRAAHSSYVAQSGRSSIQSLLRLRMSATPLSRAEMRTIVAQLAPGKDLAGLLRSALAPQGRPGLPNSAGVDQLFHPQAAALLTQASQANLTRVPVGEQFVRTIPQPAAEAATENAKSPTQLLTLSADPKANLIKQLDALLVKYQTSLAGYTFPGNVAAWQAEAEPISIEVHDPELFEQGGGLEELQRLVADHDVTGVMQHNLPTAERLTQLVAQLELLSPELADTAKQFLQARAEICVISEREVQALEKTMGLLQAQSRLADIGQLGQLAGRDDATHALFQQLNADPVNLGYLGSSKISEKLAKVKQRRCKRCGRYTWGPGEFCQRKTCARPPGTTASIWRRARAQTPDDPPWSLAVEDEHT